MSEKRSSGRERGEEGEGSWEGKVGEETSHLLQWCHSAADDCLASASSFQKIQLHLLLQSMSLRTRGRKQKYHVG